MYNVHVHSPSIEFKPQFTADDTELTNAHVYVHVDLHCIMYMYMDLFQCASNDSQKLLQFMRQTSLSSYTFPHTWTQQCKQHEHVCKQHRHDVNNIHVHVHVHTHSHVANIAGKPLQMWSHVSRCQAEDWQCRIHTSCAGTRRAWKGGSPAGGGVESLSEWHLTLESGWGWETRGMREWDMGEWGHGDMKEWDVEKWEDETWSCETRDEDCTSWDNWESITEVYKMCKGRYTTYYYVYNYYSQTTLITPDVSNGLCSPYQWWCTCTSGALRMIENSMEVS